MGESFAKVSEEVQNHLKQLSGSVVLPEGEDALELLASGWLEKEASFMSQVEEENLEEVETFSPDEAKGGLIMTYSGSLLTLGPLGEEGRNVEYVSIGLRTDVPESTRSEGSAIDGEITVGEPVQFKDGPILKSSPVYKIAVVQEELPLEAEEELLSNVTQVLADEFAEVNKTLIFE